MTGRLTLWGAGEILTTFFSRTGVPPTDFYLALINDIAPTAYVSGSEIDEPNVASYARAKVPNDAVYWTNESAPQVMLMVEDIEFTQATEDWGTVRFWALCNADKEGYIYATGDLAQPYAIPEGERAILGGGDLAIVLGPFYTEEG